MQKKIWRKLDHPRIHPEPQKRPIDSHAMTAFISGMRQLGRNVIKL
jgi:hypothetical protein